MSQSLSNTLKVFALLLLSIRCEAQKFEWVNFIGGKDAQWPVSMSVDPSGNQYATFHFVSEVKFETQTLHFSKYSLKSLVLKQNTNGKLLWYKIITSIDSSIDVHALSSKFNSKGNLTVFIASKTDLKIGADTIRRKGSTAYAIFMIEFNDTGKIVNSLHLLEGALHSQSIESDYSSNIITTDKSSNLYLSLIYSGQVKVYDSSGIINLGTTSSPVRHINFKFSNSGRNYKWATILPSPDIQINSLKVDIHGNLYAASYWTGTTPFSFNGKTISNPQKITGTIFIWDKNGNDKNWFSIEASSKNSTFLDLAVHDSNSVFVSGIYLGDSVRFDTLWKKNKKYGCYYFFALYDVNGKLKWAKTEDTTYPSSFRPFRRYCSMTNYEDDFFYFSFFLQDRWNKPIAFDGQKYMSGSNSFGFNLKVDKRGNILWGLRTFYPFFYMGTDDHDNFYFQGFWQSDTVRFGNIKSYTTNGDCYIGKTFDYAIYRGNINSGPYCAGDSLYIPYTKTGEYADTNIFFAEISDEFGNFTGKEREIGRLKSKNDGTIRGVLPMFKVASSGDYRIRIRSTSPQAQSFYKKDSLRLLIYSRDKADPGPPEWVCRGDTIKLNTYGGTKWKWSPKYNMDNDTKRQPLAWPTRDTTYKIIIADSSGCGAPDTAYKKIFVREQLKAIASFTDTGLCKNIDLKIPVHFIGGDSNYHWQWVELSVGKQAVLLYEEKLKQNDTLHYTSKLDSINPAQKLALVLWDECKSKHDTVFINMSLRKPVSLTSYFKDTTVCDGATLNLYAKTNATPGTYQYQWKDLKSNTVLSTLDFLKLKAAQTIKLKLSLISACNVDVSEFTVKVRSPLKTNLYSGTVLFNDTAICFGQSLKLNATGKYGDTTGHKFKWYLNKDLLSIADTLALNSSSNFKPGGEKKILKLVLDDNCTAGDDSVSKTITVLPAPSADFNFGKACNLTPIQFIFTGSIPDSPITTVFHWNFNGESLSTLQNPSKLYSDTGSKLTVLTISSSNGCQEEIVKNIDVKPQSKAHFTAADICETDSAVFINKSKDATGYTWKFGDGQSISTNSSISTQKHKYQITTSTTFNVTLVALNECSDSIVQAITVNQNPGATFTTTQAGNKLDLKAKTGYKNYYWQLGTTDSIKTTSPNYIYTMPNWAPIKVCLKVTDVAGCTAQTCQSITLGISQISKPAGFKIYPNPNSGNFIIEIEDPSNEVSIEIYDIFGKKVKKVERVEKVNSIDLEMANGIYIIKVRNGGMVWNQKIIVSVGEDTNR